MDVRAHAEAQQVQRSNVGRAWRVYETKRLCKCREEPGEGDGEMRSKFGHVSRDQIMKILIL